MLMLINSLFIFMVFISFMMSFMFKMSARFNKLMTMVLSYMNIMVNMVTMKLTFITLFIMILVMNILGAVPLTMIPTMYYFVTITVSLTFWFSLFICIMCTQMKSFMAHLLPHGAPMALAVFLPLVEGFSQIIRPMTLMIRLSTNLSAGHIMLYMFSYFSLLMNLPGLIGVSALLMILFILELCISILQAYIFVTLLTLYVAETI